MFFVPYAVNSRRPSSLNSSDNFVVKHFCALNHTERDDFGGEEPWWSGLKMTTDLHNGQLADSSAFADRNIWDRTEQVCSYLRTGADENFSDMLHARSTRPKQRMLYVAELTLFVAFSACVVICSR